MGGSGIHTLEVLNHTLNHFVCNEYYLSEIVTEKTSLFYLANTLDCSLSLNKWIFKLLKTLICNLIYE